MTMPNRIALLHFSSLNGCREVEVRTQQNADELLDLSRPGDTLHNVPPLTDPEELFALLDSQLASGNFVQT